MGRLNAFAGRVDAEERKMTPAQKKDAKSGLKSTRRHVATFRGRINDIVEKMEVLGFSKGITPDSDDEDNGNDDDDNDDDDDEFSGWGSFKQAKKNEMAEDGEMRKLINRFDVEWLLFVRDCEEALPAIKRDWFTETPNSFQVAPFFYVVDRLNAEYKTNDWRREMSEEAREISTTSERDVEK